MSRSAHAFLCLAAMATFGIAAQAATIPVFEYSFPASYDGTGTTITDLSAAGNDATRDTTGSGALIDDRPAGFDASLMSLTGSNGGHGVTDAIDLLNNTAVGAAGGFTMDVWFKWDGVYGTGSGPRKLIDYAGTESLRVADSQIQFSLSNGGTTLGMDIVADQWYHAVAILDTAGNAAEEDPSYPGEYTIAGTASLYVDGVLVDSVPNTVKSSFGDRLNRPIAINRWAGGQGDHYQGLNFNPTVSLGVVPEPASLLLLGIAGLLGLVAVRRHQ